MKYGLKKKLKMPKKLFLKRYTLLVYKISTYIHIHTLYLYSHTHTYIYQLTDH